MDTAVRLFLAAIVLLVMVYHEHAEGWEPKRLTAARWKWNFVESSMVRGNASDRPSRDPHPFHREWSVSAD